MPVIRSTEAITHQLHGSAFHSYVTPASGSAELCAWRLTVAAQVVGVAHRPNREEVLLILEGSARITLDGVSSELAPGDVALVGAGSEFAVDSGPTGVTAWVTTTRGLEALLPDGARVAPPWAN
jgi:mannose-6-phosphate isomerase-like protein (cupin superfamily)